MGNTIAKERLYSAISADNPEEVVSLVEAHPELANQPISEDKMATPLTRAAFLNRPHILSALLKHGAKVNLKGGHGLTASMWAARRGNLECVSLLVDSGADLTQQDRSGLTTSDLAVLFGRYEVACFLYSKNFKATKSPQEFEVLREERGSVFIDFSGFLMSLDCRIPAENAPSFVSPPLNRTASLQDPISDPRESWKHWTRRVLEFQNPPLVERSSVSVSEQPQNTALGKLKTRLGISVVSQVVPKII